MRGRALFFIYLPAFIVQLGLEDQEVHTILVPQLLWYFKSMKKQKMPEYFLGMLSFAGIWTKATWGATILRLFGGVLTPQLQAKGLWGCIWLMFLTDRAHGIGLLWVRTKRGVDIPDILRFLKLLCGWWRENGSSYGDLFLWFRVFNVDSCFEPSLDVSLYSCPSGQTPCHLKQLHLLVLGLLGMTFLSHSIQSLRIPISTLDLMSSPCSAGFCCVSYWHLLAFSLFLPLVEGFCAL